MHASPSGNYITFISSHPFIPQHRLYPFLKCRPRPSPPKLSHPIHPIPFHPVLSPSIPSSPSPSSHPLPETTLPQGTSLFASGQLICFIPPAFVFQVTFLGGWGVFVYIYFPYRRGLAFKGLFGDEVVHVDMIAGFRFSGSSWLCGTQRDGGDVAYRQAFKSICFSFIYPSLV